MPETWAVTSVEEVTDDTGTVPIWKIDLAVPERVDPSGRYTFLIPKHVLQNRAAEYGYTTAAEALEHVLYELVLWERQAAGELPMFSPASMTCEQARAEAQRQIAWCKANHVVIASTAPAAKARTKAVDPLQVILDSTRIDVVQAATVRMQIDRARLAREAGRG